MRKYWFGKRRQQQRDQLVDELGRELVNEIETWLKRRTEGAR